MQCIVRQLISRINFSVCLSVRLSISYNKYVCPQRSYVQYSPYTSYVMYGQILHILESSQYNRPSFCSNTSHVTSDLSKKLGNTHSANLLEVGRLFAPTVTESYPMKGCQ